MTFTKPAIPAAKKKDAGNLQNRGGYVQGHDCGNELPLLLVPEIPRFRIEIVQKQGFQDGNDVHRQAQKQKQQAEQKECFPMDA